MRVHILALTLAAGSAACADEHPAWVERFAFWAGTELKDLRNQVDGIDSELAGLPVPAMVNSGNRTGYQSGGKPNDEDLWVELEFSTPLRADCVVLVPLLAKGSSGQGAGFGFPRQFALEALNQDGESVLLMDETGEDFRNPGIYPVSAICPAGTLLRRIRLTAIKPWQSEGPPVLALAEMLVLDGNRNIAMQGKLKSSSSREIQPSWSRYNLTDMITPLGLPLAPNDSKVMGWHGPVASSMSQQQSVTVDLGKPLRIDEVRLLPAWRSSMAWDSYYGFPSRFKIEGSLDERFEASVLIHDQTAVSLQSPGQNVQCFAGPPSPLRFIRVTATRLRDRTGDFTFALGELQAYSNSVNVAEGATVLAKASLENDEWTLAGLTDNQSKGGLLLELPDWIRKLEQRRLLEIKREEIIVRRRLVFTRAEHALVTASVCGASGIALMAGLFSWRGHRSRVFDRERHRERLARDLHDELGSNLGSIALISSFAAQEDAAQMRLDLAEIERVARESADSMRDMVSLLAAKRGGDAADWLKVMDGLAGRLMRGVELECRLPTSPLTWEPNIETRRELYLFCKEVLHNSTRHAQPTHVKFLLSPTLEGLRIEISDDGSGFLRDDVRSGHGLGNLRERASMMKGQMMLTSAPGEGTTVILEVPRGRRWVKRK